ncbi:Serine/threonine-protein kinase ATM [Bienertia sinuspersici]
MDNDDGNLVKTKTLIEFDQSTPSLVRKKESHKLDLTSSTSMGARISKSQENGSGVLEDEKFHGNSTNGGSGGDDIMVEKKEQSVVDDFEVEKGRKNDEKVDGISIGINGSGDSKKSSYGVEFQDDRSSSHTKTNVDVSNSIAQRTRNRVVTGKKDEVDVDDGRKVDESGDGVDEENGFCVGDFVWGKVKSHPWWPGRIYDPSDASEFALKYKHEGRLLVGYFGDRTFAWCDPSQLKSFEENFEEMSNQSSLKTFVNAVQEAENEFSRLIKIQMTRFGASKSHSSLPFVVNAGVKEGVRVPDNGIGLFTVAQFQPLAMLSEIRRLAVFDSVANTLELTVLKSRLSAFYHAKFGYSLPIQCEPIGIEDLTDNQGVLLGPSFRGPDDGDWFMGPEHQSLEQNGPMTPPDTSEQKRKVKSIAELLGRETEDDLMGHAMDKRGGEVLSGKLGSKSRKKRRNVSDEYQSTMNEVTGDDGAIDEEQQSVHKCGRKKRKTVDDTQSHGADDLMVTRSSSRKKKQSSTRSATSEKKASGDTEDGGKVKHHRKMEMMPRLSIDGGSKVDEGYERISPREKKLSKYLCPPYTNILQRQKSSCSQTSSETGLVFSDVAKVGERMAKTASKLTGTPPLVKCSAETFRKSSKVSGPKQKKTDQPDHKQTSLIRVQRSMVL